MNSNLTSVQKMRVRSLKDSIRKTKAVVNGLNQLHEREKNPEKAASIMEQIQEKSGLIVSMENQLSRFEK